jgi:acyl-CoA thioesterase
MVAALGNEAMRFLVPHNRPLRNLDVTFVGPVLAGSVHMDAEVLRVGKAVTIAQARIASDGRTAATFTGVYGQGRPVTIDLAPAAPTAVAPAEELTDAAWTPEFRAPTFLQHFSLRRAQGAQPFAGAALRSSKIYMRHRDPSALTESHIVALIDCVPPPILQMMTVEAPHSSMTWSLQFLRHAYHHSPEAWWRIDTEIQSAAEGYCQDTSVVIDPNGVPMALSRQLVAVFG